MTCKICHDTGFTTTQVWFAAYRRMVDAKQICDCPAGDRVFAPIQARQSSTAYPAGPDARPAGDTP